jgi:hypothetical protein
VGIRHLRISTIEGRRPGLGSTGDRAISLQKPRRERGEAPLLPRSNQVRVKIRPGNAKEMQCLVREAVKTALAAGSAALTSAGTSPRLEDDERDLSARALLVKLVSAIERNDLWPQP